MSLNLPHYFLEKSIPSDWYTKWKTGTGLETLELPPLPPKGRKRDVYEEGEVLGSVMYIEDKPKGVEPGMLCYIRDAHYEREAFNIILSHLVRNKLDDPIAKFFMRHQNDRKNPAIYFDELRDLQKSPPVYNEKNLKIIQDLFRKIENDPASRKLLVQELQLLPEGRRLRKFLIKQDYKDPKWSNKPSISTKRAMLTSKAQKIGEKWGSGIKKIAAWGHNLYKWMVGSKHEANSSAFFESLSTRVANASGMNTQVQGIIHGTYEKPPHSKLMTIVEYEEGFRDLSDRLLGGDQKDGNFIVEMELGVDGKPKPKRDKDGFYHTDSSIENVGENLITALRQNDYDFFGSEGGNKGVDGRNQFFGIDFGHAYEQEENHLVGTKKKPNLTDDFSFQQPSAKIKNVTALYDNPLSEKMKGVYILAKLRGKLSHEDEYRIIQSYTNRGNTEAERLRNNKFCDKLRGIQLDQDYKVFDEHLSKAEELEKDPGCKGFKAGVLKRYEAAISTDKRLLDVFSKRIGLTADQLDFIENMEKLCSETTDLSPHAFNKGTDPDKIIQLEREVIPLKSALLALKNTLKEMDEQGKKGNVYDKYKALEKKTKEKLEVAEAKLRRAYQEHAVVKTKHLRVYPRSSRVECQLVMTNTGKYRISLSIPEKDPKKLKEKIEEIRRRILSFAHIKISGGVESNILEFTCAPEDLKKLQGVFTEDRIKQFKEPFGNYSFYRAGKGGKQKKAKATAFYKDTKTGELYYIKKSEDYPADNITEVVTSTLMTSVIGETHAVPYEFERNKLDGSMYLKSRCYEGFQSLGSFFPEEDREGWLASNPNKLANKKAIDKHFEDIELREDMANVLAGCLWVGDYDCQVENICFYKDKHGRKRVAKFDDGWGLAEIGAIDQTKVDLFDWKWFMGGRATHKGVLPKGLPTNHFNDYPYIVHSVIFADALEALVEKADLKLRGEEGPVSQALDKISQAFKEDPEKQKQAFLQFADHTKIKVPQEVKNKADNVKNYIESVLKYQMKQRTNSMALLSALLRIRVRMSNDEYNKTGGIVFLKKDMELLEKAMRRFKPGQKVADILPNLDVPEPFDKVPKDFLKQALKIAETRSKELKGDDEKRLRFEDCCKICSVLTNEKNDLEFPEPTRERRGMTFLHDTLQRTKSAPILDLPKPKPTRTNNFSPRDNRF